MEQSESISTVFVPEPEKEFGRKDYSKKVMTEKPAAESEYLKARRKAKQGLK